MNEWECNDDVLYPKSFLFPDYILQEDWHNTLLLNEHLQKKKEQTNLCRPMHAVSHRCMYGN